MRYLCMVFVLLTAIPAVSQTLLSGSIRTPQGNGLDNVTIRVAGTKVEDRSGDKGRYSLLVPSGRIAITFSKVGYQALTLELDLYGLQRFSQDITLYPGSKLLDEVNITDRSRSATNATFIDPAGSIFLPSASGNFEALLKTLPGISANNELTSQYNVRGGNFDENLVYVNDVEIYRPFLVRNGQQEGLSFVNSELAGQIKFSAGGFEARYGDKMSSVLDVTYGKPDSSELTVSGGILGYSITAKHAAKNGRSYLLAGLRQKFNRSVLKSQPTKGAYNPDFYDFQVLYHRNIGKKSALSYFGDFNLSKFLFVPASSETEFGAFDEQYRLQIRYTGEEHDHYESWMNSLTFTYRPTERVNVKWINSLFRINESETFDVEGHYTFDELESGKSATVKANLASGTRSAHARNHLRADIYSTELKAYLQKGRSYFESGVRYQFDQIDDRLNEYSVIDTAGDTSAGGVLSDVISSENHVAISRISFYMQDAVVLNSRLTLSAGVRGNFNTGNREFLLTPRVSLAFQPRNPDVTYRFAAGSYSQPSFYREMRMFNGQLVLNTRAQRSVHFLAGLDRSFIKLNTRIKFTSEIYYKALSDLVPYKIENLRVRYLADQRAKGYAAGVDLSFSGELVKDMESSFRLSLMKTMEDIEGDFFNRTTASGSTERVEPGLLKRPADQRINASVFFQDKLFSSPSNKVHLTFLYGSSLPVGPPQTERYRDVFKIPAYKRADIGFSKDFLDASMQRRSAKLNKYFSSFILYAGIFNLLDNNNTVSYLWLKDVYDNQYAIPNYLSGRRVNVKLIARFQ